MAVAEIEALTGYQFDSTELQSLSEINDLQRAELDKDDTKMNLYFNPVLYQSVKSNKMSTVQTIKHLCVFENSCCLFHF